MIFAAATDERTLFVFSSPEEAVAYCEGIDVEDGGWLFWDERGTPFQAQFLAPNYRGSFGGVGSGTYQLVSTQSLPSLTETLAGLNALEANPFFQSIDAVWEHLAVVPSVPQHGA